MRTVVAVALLCLAVPLFAADDPRIEEGIKLHDAGRYDEAIAKYKAVLADDPGNRMAIYEMGFAYQAKGDYAACRATLEPAIQKRDRLQPLMMGILGNCLDLAGDSRRAIEIYRRGLKIDPNDTQLLYNLAVTLAGQKKHAEARELLKKELVLRPGHGSGRYLLAQLFEAEGFRAPAILEYLRFLATDFRTAERRADAAKRMVALLSLGVEKKQEGEVNITIDPASRTEEGDFKGWEMMLAIAAAAQFTEDQAALSDFERTRAQVASSIRMLLEVPPKGRNYSTQHNLPFFRQLEEKKLLDTVAGIAIAPLGLAGAQEWGQANEAAIREYSQFVGGLSQ